MLNKGLFITFEGGECSGKTTVINKIYDTLLKENISTIKTREPGGSNIAEQIRTILLNKDNTSMTSEAEALLYAASRMQHLKETVIPNLNLNKVILCDRYIDSSFVYQGFGRNLGIENIKKVNTFALEYMPDLTIFIDIKPEIALKRLENREKSDRLDNESLKFHEDVYDGYLKIADLYKDRIVKINGNDTPENITNKCLDLIYKLIKKSNI